MWKLLLLLMITSLLVLSCGDPTSDPIDDKCTENSYYQCFRGDIYWFNSCDKLGNIKENCMDTQICKDLDNSSSICEEKTTECTSHNYYQCNEGSIYWFNSCDVLEDIKETCTETQKCKDIDLSSSICEEKTTECTSHNYYQCNEGNIYWFDSCDVLEDIKETCTETQVCKDINNSSSICEDETVECTSHSYSQCFRGDIYWFDSCNVLEDTKEACAETQTCKDIDNSSSICEEGIAECISHSYYQCFRGDVYWFDSCDVLEDVKEDCTEAEICKDIDYYSSICEEETVECVSHSYYQCNAGNVYWFDSCNVLEGIKETCTDTQTCENIDNFSSICEENPVDDICINNSACKDNFSGIKINEITQNNIFYVDPINGNDDNDGSINMPWKNLQIVLDNKVETKKTSSSPLIDKNAGASVKAGDVIFLKSGDYGSIIVREAYNADFITIKSENNSAYLSKLDVKGASKWRFHSLNITHGPTSVNNKTVLVSVRNDNFYGEVNNIVIDESKVSSIEDSSSWTLNDWLNNVSNGIYVDGENILLFKNEVKNINIGIYLEGKNSVAINNTIENFSEDGIRVLGNNNLIENSIIKNCYNINEQHNDGIQSYALNGVTVKNVLIRNNKIFGHVMMNYSDAGNVGVQGIGCFDGYYEDWVVENNLVVVDNWHGITFLGAKNVKIINNTVIDLNKDNSNNKPSPWIMINPHKNGSLSTNSIIRNNIVENKVVPSNDTINDSNYEFNKSDSSSIFVSFDNLNFNLKSSATDLIDMGSSIFAPVIDIDWKSRPNGSGIDIGAYEY